MNTNPLPLVSTPDAVRDISLGIQQASRLHNQTFPASQIPVVTKKVASHPQGLAHQQPLNRDLTNLYHSPLPTPYYGPPARKDGSPLALLLDSGEEGGREKTATTPAEVKRVTKNHGTMSPLFRANVSKQSSSEQHHLSTPQSNRLRTLSSPNQDTPTFSSPSKVTHIRPNFTPATLPKEAVPPPRTSDISATPHERLRISPPGVATMPNPPPKTDNVSATPQQKAECDTPLQAGGTARLSSAQRAHEMLADQVRALPRHAEPQFECVSL